MERICKTLEKYDKRKEDRSPQKTKRLKRHNEFGDFNNKKKETIEKGNKRKSDSQKKKIPTPKRQQELANKTKSSEKRRRKNKSIPKGVKLIF